MLRVSPCMNPDTFFSSVTCCRRETCSNRQCRWLCCQCLECPEQWQHEDKTKIEQKAKGRMLWLQKSYGQCSASWMIKGDSSHPEGFCVTTCGRCSCQNGAQAASVPSTSCTCKDVDYAGDSYGCAQQVLPALRCSNDHKMLWKALSCIALCCIQTSVTLKGIVIQPASSCGS